MAPLALCWLGCALIQGFVAVSYPYQFLALWWLGVVVVTLASCQWKTLTDALENPLGTLALAGAASACLVMAALALPWNAWSEKRAEQADIFRGIERFTSPGQVVWEGAGYAFGREPASVYWFTPTLVTGLERAGVLNAFDVGRLAATPPHLVIMDGRFSPAVDASGQEARAFLFRNYLPISPYLDLWLPAAVGRVSPQSQSLVLRPLLPGSYRLVAFPQLPAMSPWFAAGPLTEIQEARLLPKSFPVEGLTFETAAKWRRDGEGVLLELGEGQTVEVRLKGEGSLVVALAPVGVGNVYYPAWGGRAAGGAGGQS